MKKYVIVACMLLLAGGAQAHSRVDGTEPVDGAVLATAPPEISLSFAKDIRLTRVELLRQNHQAIRLDLGSQTKFDRAFTLPLQGLGSGTYRIKWRGLGQDGHALTGSFSFTVD